MIQHLLFLNPLTKKQHSSLTQILHQFKKNKLFKNNSKTAKILQLMISNQVRLKRISFSFNILIQQIKKKNSFFSIGKIMNITRLRYSEIESALQNKKLLISFEDDKDQGFVLRRKLNCKSLQQNDTTKKRPSSGVSHYNKFKDITNSLQNSSINHRSLTTAFMRKTKNTSTFTNQFFSRPKTANHYSSLKQRKSIKIDIFQQLFKQIKKHFIQIIAQEQRNETIEDLKYILNILQKQPDPLSIFQQFQKLQNHLSKYLKHRISHLCFYLIYWKFYECFYQQPSEKEIKILSLVQYHTRTFYFRKVALLVCLQLQQKYLKINKFQESRNYAIKSLKLAVLIDDRYEEIKILEYLGVIKFYEGILNSRGNNVLTEEQRVNILKHYRQEDQIPKIFNFMQKSMTKNINIQDTNIENQSITDESINYFKNEKISFNQGQNFLQNDVPRQNLKKFSRNFHGILKKIGRKNHVQETIKKINEIGQVKKFIGKDNFITLCPQGNSILNTNQIQVLVTHKKYKQIEKNKHFFKKQLPSIINNLEVLILSVLQSNLKFEKVNKVQI